MKKITLIYLLFFAALAMNAQTETYFIDWSFNSTPTAEGDANSSRTVEVGDTVTWVWYANGVHNVSSEAEATESFESEFLGQGSEFSYTFTEVGTNPYVCTPHSFNMFGTITVVPDGSLSTENFSVLDNLSLYPNPADDFVYLKMNGNSTSTIDIAVYNTLGQKLMEFKKSASDNLNLNLSELNSGIYFLKFKEGENSVTKRLIIR